MKLWAHRGCSQRYPENTMLAFEKAKQIKGLSGIELDIQLTKDEELVVIHDEKVDRTTDGIGYVKDYTLVELKKLNIKAGESFEKIPTMKEVLDLLAEDMKHGLLLNVELKNSMISYKGMEEKMLALAYQKGVHNGIVYSTFYAKSLEKIRLLDRNAVLAILDEKVSDCMYKLKGGCGAIALHPYWKGIDLTKEQLSNYTVRAWMTGHLFPEKSTGTILDMESLKKTGITDLILNEPEAYL
jgi:glycerophosphoryl diester phosphodiesterase